MQRRNAVAGRWFRSMPQEPSGRIWLTTEANKVYKIPRVGKRLLQPAPLSPLTARERTAERSVSLECVSRPELPNTVFESLACRRRTNAFHNFLQGAR